MFEQPDPFSSQHVEESIDLFSANDLPPDAFGEQARLNPNERLIHDMQKLYAFERKRYLRALQRVEDRLVEQYVTNSERSAPLPVLPGQQARSSRTIQQGRLHSMEQKKSRMSTFGRRVSVLVAVLVMGVLVGSLVLVMNAAHQKTTQNPNHSTITGSGPSGTPTVPSGAPTVMPTPNPTQQGSAVYTSPASYDSYYAFAWSPDGKRIASSTRNQVQVWDATTGKNQKVFTPSGSGASVLALAWSPDGRSLAMGGEIIDPVTGAVKQTLPSSQAFAGASGSSRLSATNPFSGGNMVYATAWSPDGTLMASALNGNSYGNVVVVWNVNTGQIITTFRGQADNGVSTVSWSSDDKYVVSAGFDGTVQVWNAHTAQVIFQEKGISAAFSPTGMTLALSNDLSNTVQVWDVTANKEITSYSTPSPEALTWSPDGKEVAVASGSNVVIVNASTGSKISAFTGRAHTIRSLAWSPDGKYIVTGGGDEAGGNYAQVWQV